MSWQRKKPCTDHLGRSYPSLKAMCGSWPVRDPSNYLRRLERGMTQREALTKRPRKPVSEPRPRCPFCGEARPVADGFYADGARCWRCRTCRRSYESGPGGTGRKRDNLNAVRARQRRGIGMTSDCKRVVWNNDEPDGGGDAR